MRKLASLIVFVILCSGCTFYKYTAIKAKGRELKIPMMGIYTAQGEEVDIRFERTFCLGKDCVYDKSVQNNKRQTSVNSPVRP